MNDALLASKSNEWNTPDNVLDLVRAMGPIGLDPCSNANSIVNAKVEYRLDRGQDGLKESWNTDTIGICFVNPPYGRELPKWVAKVMQETEDRGRDETIFLVASRTDTKWFHKLMWWADAICFWSGRLTFLGAKNPAPFPSAVFYRGPNRVDFIRVFSVAGNAVRL